MLAGAGIALTLACQCSAAGTWTRLVRNAPGSVALMLLLSDGTVMAAQNSGTVGNGWYRLTPDSHGSYINGTWTTLASMHDTRLWYSSAVLKDGRVFVAGGEYGTGGAKAEVYNPTLNVWTQTTPPTTLLDPSQTSPAVGGNQGFIDSTAKIIANGNLLVTPVAPKTYGGTLIFNTLTNTWSAGPTLIRGGNQDEASWVKLPDQTIVTIDPFGTNSERYNPTTNSWINDAVVPIAMYDSVAGEMGPAVLLADGRAFFIGATGHTALYTPSGSTAPGSWAAGPDVPNGLAAPDAPGAMMVNGKMLCAVGPPVYFDSTLGYVFPSPTSFFEYDPIANSFSSAGAPVGTSDNVPPYSTLMLALPDGNILYSHFGMDLYVYHPDGAPLLAGKPVINSIAPNADGSYHLIGAGLNGISEGAAYGDDAQMDTNYPLVRLVDGSGNVSYARTYNWSSTGVMTGAQAVSCEFRPPTSLPPGPFSLYAVANGNASDPYTFQSPGTISLSVAGSPLIYDNAGNGNNNGRVDPGESAIGLLVVLQNSGTVPATGVSATLVSNTPTVTVVAPLSSYPPISGGGGAATNLNFYTINVFPSHICGAPISLTLNITSDQSTASVSFVLSSGLPGAISSPQTFTYSGAAVAIPDGVATGVTVNLPVSGLSGVVSDVNFRINGTSCSAAAGSTTVGLSHTWVGDLTLTLRSPTGTVVSLMDRPGGVNNNGHNFCNTTLDDQATASIQSVSPSGNPWSGSFQPNSPLSAINGQNPNGTWQFKAVDNFASDAGTIRGFSVIITTQAPATCSPPNNCVGPGVGSDPAPLAGCIGGSASFTVAATGTEPLMYQWRKNTANISGAVSNVYSIPAAVNSDAGSYDCVISNNCGSATSNAATLSICGADFNCSSSVTVSDIFAFLSAWFGQTGLVGPGQTADFNGDNLVNVADIFAFLTAWFAGCP